MIPLTDPESTYEEDFHRHVFHDDDGESIAVIEFDDIEDDRGGLWCEVTVYCKFSGSDPVVAFQRTNLLTTTASGVKGIVTKLGDTGSMHWDGGMDTAVYRSVKSYRTQISEGDWAEAQPNVENETPYLLRPFIANAGVTVLYGPPGSNKSMFALRLALGVATGEGYNGEKPLRTGPVMYVDFEDEVRTHEHRLTAIANAEEMEDIDKSILHVRITRNLKDARRTLRRTVRDEDIALVVIDSIGLARAADVSGSEATIKLFKMFGQLGASVLAIDHMTKEDNKRVWTGKMDAREATPIGSQFTQSSARLAWFMNVLPQSTNKEKKVNLHNTKYNHTPQHKPIGMSVSLDWNENDILTSALFRADEQSHEVMVQEALKPSKAQELLVWHFKQQRRDDDGKMVGVIPMSYKDMEKGTNMAYGTISSIVGTKHKAWWEKLSGSQQWTLTPQGLEDAMMFSAFLSSGENDE